VTQENLLKSAAAAVKSRPDELPERVSGLADTVRKLERELAEAKKALALAGPAATGGSVLEQVGAVPFVGRVLDDLDPKELRGLLDAERQSHGSGVFAIVATRDGRASIAVSVSPDLVATNSAVDLVRAGVAALGGQGGGGRPDIAQGGGPEAAKAADAIAAVKAAIRQAGAA
jgi:alanyl-tRNA synthetase